MDLLDIESADSYFTAMVQLLEQNGMVIIKQEDSLLLIVRLMMMVDYLILMFQIQQGFLVE